MSNYDRELTVAEAAVSRAAALCRSVRAEVSPDVLAKRDKSPVTVADFGSQALVARALREAFPADPLVAEEDAAELRAEGQKPLLDSVVRHLRGHLGSDVDADSALTWIDLGGAGTGSRFWTLDPIDGTKGFLRNEQYAVALALLIDGRPQVAALACPNLVVEGFSSPGAVFLAERGQGARVRPLDGDAPARTIHVRSLSDPSQARFCESVESGHSDQGESARIAAHLGLKAEPVRLDSQAKYGVVALGGAEIYLRLPTRADYREKIWDHAAGLLVIEEAGGRVS
ncbi:MAG TPA: 3'(2'),5'-bisphosphate nucleotidase, partial [Isosphaeraceae bacterium]|nr:3'(2'),5'-bisphosphate nucleotidase [Isosphaeraceae bacterium]